MLALMAVIVFGAMAAWAWQPATGGVAFACECANIDAPVTCDGGKTYPNQCVADCVHATGCVPSGGGGTQ